MQDERKLLERYRSFFTTYISLYGISLVISIFLSSYYSFRITEILSHPAEDGQCKLGKESVGIHCFSDFYGPITKVNMNNPWEGAPTTYPPLGEFIYKPFAYLHQLFPLSHVSLVCFLIFGMLCCSIPAFHARITGRLSSSSSALVMIFIITSAPVLITLDRGNSQFILLPIIYFLTLSALEERNKKVLYWGFLCVLLRPQFILLGVFFILTRDFKNFIKWIIYCPIGLILSFVLYPKGFLNNIESYISQLSQHNNSYHFTGMLWPANISISSTIVTLNRSIAYVFPAIVNSDPKGTWVFLPNFVIAFLFFILVVVGFLKSKEIPKFSMLLFSLLSPVLLQTISPTYYLVILVAPVSILFIEYLSITDAKYRWNTSVVNSRQLQEYFSDRVLRIQTFFIVNILLIPWAIPWFLISENPMIKVSGAISSNYLLGQIFLLFFYLTLVFKRVSPLKMKPS